MLDEKYILVIEDDFDLLWLIKRILSMNGFHVLTAVTGEEAINNFSRNLFNIQAIILDLSLPDKNGKSICREFMKVAPEIPIVITTGFEDRTQKKELEEMGVRGYLIKPFDIMHLVQFVSQII